MSRFGFCGPSYTSESPNVAANRCVNWYPETVEGDGATAVAMYPTPGLSPFTTLLGTQVEGLYPFNDRLFAVGSNFAEIASDGTVTPYTFLPASTGPVTMAANNSGQLLICSAEQAWIFPQLVPNAISAASIDVGSATISSITVAFFSYGLPDQYQVTIVFTGPTPAAWNPVGVHFSYVTITGLTTLTYLNGQVLIPLSGGGTNTVVFSPGSYGPAHSTVSETGTAYDTWPQATFTLTALPSFQAGDKVTPTGLTHLTSLNGQTLQVTKIVGNVVTVNVPTGTIYVYTGPETGDLVTPGTLTTPTQVLTDSGPIAMIGYSDDYFLALLENSQQFQISALGDGTTWNPIDKYQISEFSDNVISMFVDHREVWFFGAKNTIVYFDSGDPLVPFQPIPGAYIEQGIAARYSVSKLDNSIFWIGADERGHGIAWRANGYTPVRVSNHAVENAWRKYSTLSDARTYTYQENGHSFWVVWFPTADATWVYDAATGQWHERTWFSGGVDHAHRSCCHAFIFGKHLVGDRASGVVYEQNIETLTDTVAGAEGPIHRVRSAPHIASEQEWMFHQQLQVYLEPGLTTSSVPNPVISLDWSNDAGHTWSNSYAVSAGATGEFRKRCMWRRLGRARDRIYRITCTDAIPWRIVDAYLKAEPGFQPQQRLVDRIKQGA